LIGALKEDLLFLAGDLFDPLEEPIPLLGEQDLFLAKFLFAQVAEGFVLAEDFVNECHQSGTGFQPVSKVLLTAETQRVA
jgi:hypothetical protein